MLSFAAALCFFFNIKITFLFYSDELFREYCSVSRILISFAENKSFFTLAAAFTDRFNMNWMRAYITITFCKTIFFDFF